MNLLLVEVSQKGGFRTANDGDHDLLWGNLSRGDVPREIAYGALWQCRSADVGLDGAKSYLVVFIRLEFVGELFQVATAAGQDIVFAPTEQVFWDEPPLLKSIGAIGTKSCHSRCGGVLNLEDLDRCPAQGNPGVNFDWVQGFLLA